MTRLWCLGCTGPLVAVFAVVALAGCSSSSSPPDDTTKIKQTLVGEFADMAHGNGDSACKRMTSDEQRKIADQWKQGSTCPDAIKSVSENLTDDVKKGMLSVKVNKVTINGNTATVANSDISSSEGDVSSLLTDSEPTEFTKQSNGDWLISG